MQAEWSNPDVVPVVKVGALNVAELFHGPTLAFKDFGQQVLCRMLGYYADKRDRDITLVSAEPSRVHGVCVGGIRRAQPMDKEMTTLRWVDPSFLNATWTLRTQGHET